MHENVLAAAGRSDEAVALGGVVEPDRTIALLDCSGRLVMVRPVYARIVPWLTARRT